MKRKEPSPTTTAIYQDLEFMSQTIDGLLKKITRLEKLCDLQTKNLKEQSSMLDAHHAILSNIIFDAEQEKGVS